MEEQYLFGEKYDAIITNVLMIIVIFVIGALCGIGMTLMIEHWF